MPRRFLLPAIMAAIAAVVGNIFAASLDAAFHFSRQGRLGVQGCAFLLVLVLTALFEGGVKIPGYFAYHRYCYLADMQRASVLRQWARRFASLQLGPGPRYVAVAE